MTCDVRILREYGVDEDTIEEIRTFDRVEFNSDRRFYRRLNNAGEYVGDTAAQEQLPEIHTVADMLDEIESASFNFPPNVIVKTSLYCFDEPNIAMHVH